VPLTRGTIAAHACAHLPRFDLDLSCQAGAEHFQQCAEFPLLRNRSLRALAVTVLPIPLARWAAKTRPSPCSGAFHKRLNWELSGWAASDVDSTCTQQFALWAAGKTQSDGSNAHRKTCRGGLMAQVDPWEKAADCERAIRITLDPLHRETLINIREFWIALAHKSRFLSDDDLANQIEMIGRLHAKLDCDARP
jgi:hypothetical protein